MARIPLGGHALTLVRIAPALRSAAAAHAAHHAGPQDDPAKGARDGRQPVGMVGRHTKGILEAGLFQARLPGRPFATMRQE